MKVLVTGANGFIGGAIVKELVKNNHAVEVLVNRGSEFKFAEDYAGRISAVRQADIRIPIDIQNSGETDQIDVVIHSAGLAHQFAARQSADFRDINATGTGNVAELAVRRQVRHFILISSVSVYGNAAEKESAKGADEAFRLTGISEDMRCQPTDDYARSKLEGEKKAREICGKNNIALTILRPATVIGEGDRGNVRRLIEAIDKKRFLWIGNGGNYKSLIYKGDVANACLKIMEIGATRTDIYNVTAEPLKMCEIVSEIGRHLKRKIPALAVPPPILNLAFAFNRQTLNIEEINKLSETVGKWLADDVFSGEKIELERGFRAATPVREAIKREVEFYRQQQ